MDVQLNGIGRFTEDVVGTPPHNDAVLRFRQGTDHFRLIAEQVFIGDKIIPIRRNGAAVKHVAGNAEQGRAPEGFIRLGKEIFTDAAVCGSQLQQLPVVKGPAQLLSQHLPHGMSAAAKPTGNRNDMVIRHRMTSLPDRARISFFRILIIDQFG